MRLENEFSISKLKACISELDVLSSSFPKKPFVLSDRLHTLDDNFVWESAPGI